MNLGNITHYYLSDKDPFLSLSDFNGDDNHPAFIEMLNKHKNVDGYNRRYGKSYLKQRREIENQLRELFIKRGGNPKRQYPVYFVLGESNWFKNLNANHLEINIPISKLPKDKVSITYPDSFVALTAKEKPYFNKVFLLDEIPQAINEFGPPSNRLAESYERYWEGDFELYYEVQVWDDEVLQQYR